MENMTEADKENAERIDREFWAQGGKALDKLLAEWKERKFTRIQMTSAVWATLKQSEHAPLVAAYIFANMAERLIKADQKDAAADQTVSE